MNIFTKSFNPSSGYLNSDLVLFPTSQDFYLSDYQSVMDEKDYLRLWSQSVWPEDHFTAEENRKDLLLHIKDNIEHRAYGYMIYTPDKVKCLGSVYFNSLEGLSKWYEIAPEMHHEIKQNFSARIDYWCIKNMDEKVTRSLIDWISADWGINVLFVSRNVLTERAATMKSLAAIQTANLKSKSSDSWLELYSVK